MAGPLGDSLELLQDPEVDETLEHLWASAVRIQTQTKTLIPKTAFGTEEENDLLTLCTAGEVWVQFQWSVQEETSVRRTGRQSVSWWPRVTGEADVACAFKRVTRTFQVEADEEEVTTQRRRWLTNALDGSPVCRLLKICDSEYVWGSSETHFRRVTLLGIGTRSWGWTGR